MYLRKAKPEILKKVEESKTSSLASFVCSHCGEKSSLSFKRVDDQGNSFCCQGCESVFHFISAHEFGKYYQLKDQFSKRNFKPFSSTEFSSWDSCENLEFKSSLMYWDELEIFCPDIHCVACSWLIEASLAQVSGVLSSKVNIFKRTVKLKLEKDIKLSEIAEAIASVGYRPELTKTDEAEKRIKKQMLLEIGVSAFCAGNIMLFSVAQYAGTEKDWTGLFNWLSFLLFIPVLVFSAKSFFKKAAGNIKNKVLTVDFSISLVLILATGLSLFNLIKGEYDHYFDSLSIFVFLFLSSRYLLYQVEKKHQSLLDNHFALPTENYLNLLNNSIPHHEVKIGDKLHVKLEQHIYFGSKLLSEEALINYAHLNGESEPVLVKKGDFIESGAINLSKNIVVEAIQTFHESSFSKTIDTLKEGWIKNSSFVLKTSRLSSLLLIFSLLTSSLLLLTGGANQLNNILAVLIITCPCALSLAAPLIYANALSWLYKKGVFVKESETLEKLNKIEHVFFDKTGTVTDGLSVSFGNKLSQSQSNALFSLVRLSVHPISIAIKKKLNLENFSKVEKFKEHIGRGVEGVIDRRFVELIQIDQNLVFRIDDKDISKIQIKEYLRKEAHDLFEYLNKQKIKTHLISGDKEEKVKAISKALNTASYFSQVKPMQKHDIIENFPNSLMIGDGLNDIYALGGSLVGVAFQEVSKINLKTSDVFLSEQNLNKILLLLRISKTVSMRLHLTLGLSFLFNFVGLVFAASGYVNPLVAAIAMPINSLLVVALSSRRIRGK